MATFTKELLSGSTNGRPIKVAATATAGTLIHTASATAGVIDELWIYASNSSTDAQLLTVELGGVTDPDDLVVTALPGSTEAALVVVIPGVPITGGVDVKAFSTDADVVNIVGYVNRITPAP